MHLKMNTQKASPSTILATPSTIVIFDFVETTQTKYTAIDND
jgi:hypothetical protein